MGLTNTLKSASLARACVSEAARARGGPKAGDRAGASALGAALAGLLLASAALLAFAPPSSAHGGTDSFIASGAVYSVAWSADGSRFAAATSSGNITIYDGVLHFESARWHAHDGPINEVVFSPDGRKVASVSGAYRIASTEQTLKVWDIGTVPPTLLLNITDFYDWVTSVAWSPDGTMIAASSGVDNHDDPTKIYGEVKFWNAVTGTLVWNATAHEPQFAENSSYPARIAWSPDGSRVAALGHLSDLWLLYPYEQPRRMELINHSYRDLIGHASHGWAVSWSPDSRYIVGGFSYDYTRPSASTSDFAPDGRTDSGPVIVFDPTQKNADGYAVQLMRADIHSKPAEWVSWDPTGTYIASCSGADLVNATGGQVRAGQDGVVDAGELIAWDFRNSTRGQLKPVNVWLFGTSWCSSDAFQPNRLAVLVGNADSTVRLYAFDEDKDGCMVWADAADLDPTVCAAPTLPVAAFIEAWGLPIALGAGAAGAAGVWAWRRGRSLRAEPTPRGGRGSPRDGRRRTGGRSHGPRRR
jgi:WD40 repeat protein